VLPVLAVPGCGLARAGLAPVWRTAVCPSRARPR